MKVLFTADWHIKLGQKNVPRDWQKNRYKLLFEKLFDLQHECDLMIIGGDIFDKLPNIEELELYFDFIIGVTTKTFIFDGNHEATKRGHTFFHNLIDVTSVLNSNVEILRKPFSYRNIIDFIPYTHLKTFDPKNFSSDILCTHVRGAILPHVKPEIDLTKLNRWKTVLAGDLHAYSNSQRNILYPGSPLSTSFHRNSIRNGVILFDTNTRVHNWIDLGLPQLIRKTVQSEEEMIATKYDHTIYELEGDIKSLANVNTENELLDKKIIHKNTKAKIDFTDLSLSDEVELYLRTILNLKDNDIEYIMGVLHANIKEDDLV